MIVSLALLLAPLAQITVTIPATDSKCIASGSNSNWNDNRFRAYWSTGSQGFVDGFAKFDLSGIPAGSTITAMTLRAYHEAGFGNPYNSPEVRVYRVASDAWSRSNPGDAHPGLNEALTGLYTTFPANDLVPVDFVINVGAANWAADLLDGSLSLALRNEAGLVSRYSYVYFYGSDSTPAPPELIVEYTGGPSLTINNLIGGAVAGFQVANATPNGQVGVALSRFGGGPVAMNTGICGVLSVSMQPPLMVVGVGPANGSGARNFLLNVPASATGRQIWSQGLDFASCMLTNGVTQVVG